jgi:hypothetical protein
VGGAESMMCASVVCWRAACLGVGGPSRAGFPRRGNGKGAINFLAAAGLKTLDSEYGC